ncbi:hypothetical protein SDC9_168458 [bioreactor metagenome]|uniref:Uncharacterized protein n=1 Tax=bioreactor metagenome TaxID=1076179 RepID=A0A645G5K4_9ZZZZ
MLHNKKWKDQKQKMINNSQVSLHLGTDSVKIEIENSNHHLKRQAKIGLFKNALLYYRKEEYFCMNQSILIENYFARRKYYGKKNENDGRQ